MAHKGSVSVAGWEACSKVLHFSENRARKGEENHREDFRPSINCVWLFGWEIMRALRTSQWQFQLLQLQLLCVGYSLCVCVCVCLSINKHTHTHKRILTITHTLTHSQRENLALLSMLLYAVCCEFWAPGWKFHEKHTLASTRTAATHTAATHTAVTHTALTHTALTHTQHKPTQRDRTHSHCSLARSEGRKVVCGWIGG